MKLLLFAGAGMSIELGVPAMEGMATEFLAHSEQWNAEPALVRKMMGDILDIERLMESLDQISAARNSLPALGDLNIPLDRVETVRSEGEWFVQLIYRFPLTSPNYLLYQRRSACYSNLRQNIPYDVNNYRTEGESHGKRGVDPGK